ncbi:hypothetical protein D9758_002674 [Tetrapyrgos nigripes]|uniref:Uncharacterized protein n=1 Tax=Tetrapyrgos nigripes TaxID=182062 RepID=A0A8H5GRE7_9AGAR|nr:hypothetical protein D9758_002674 [Tetrapyrgos nigripes]
MSSHYQQTEYPQALEDDPASSPSSSSQDWPPSIIVDHPTGNKTDLNDSYFSLPYTRRPQLKSRRSKSDLAQRSSRMKHDGSSSRSRHASSSASTQALLIITNEQLKQRIATLENEQTRAVNMFAELVQERNSLLKELAEASTKIKMYEVQYEAARREIRNANQIIQRLEEQRAEAEQDATKQRKKVRTLITEKLVKEGWDEGYREGIEEGYSSVVQRSDHGGDGGPWNPRIFSRLRRSRKTERKSSADDSDEDGQSSSTPGGTGSRRGSNPRQRLDSRSSSRHISPPVRPPSAPPSTGRAYSLARSITPRPPLPHHSSEPFPTNVSSPESIHPIIAPQPSQTQVFDVPHNPLPDPAINVFDANPSPHIPANDGHDFPGSSEPPPVVAKGATMDRRHEEVRGRTLESAKDRKPRSRMTSRASTRISEYDLVSPPRGSSIRSSNVQREVPQRNFVPGASERSDPMYDTSKQMVEEWRNVVDPDQGPHQDNPRSPTVQSPPQNSPPLRSKTPNQGQHLITPFVSFANRMSTIPHAATSSLQSPRVSGGPRQPREPVRSMTSPPGFEMSNAGPSTSQAMDASRRQSRSAASPPHRKHDRVDTFNRGPVDQPVASTSRQPPSSSTSPPVYDPPSGTARGKTPISWLRKQFQRSYSNPAIPHDINIEIEPPSQSPSDSNPTTTVLNPILLSPEHANKPIPLPNDIIATATRGVEVLGPSSTPVPNSITITLPDEELPLGFVPMAPLIPTGDINNGRFPPMRSPTPRDRERERHQSQPRRVQSPEIFSPVPNNPVLSDPFTMSPIPRPGTAPSVVTGIASNGHMRSDKSTSPRSRALSFGFGLGRWGGTSPDPARPISIFSESDV